MNPNTRLLIEELNSAPESVQKEVLDFLLFLKSRQMGEGRVDDLLPLAQSTWAPDWDSPEEDDAWRGLKL